MELNKISNKIYQISYIGYKISDILIQISYKSILDILYPILGVVGWCEGAVYLTSLGRPTDIGLQLGKACYPCSG